MAKATRRNLWKAAERIIKRDKELINQVGQGKTGDELILEVANHIRARTGKYLHLPPLVKPPV